MSVLVEDNPARRRFEILVDDRLAGFAAYEPHQDTIVFTHTRVDEEYRDRGVGSALARGALDQVRQRGERVVARCPFISAFIDRHPEYAGLLGST
ncbi:MAG TPA: GNAT family N-acetyltransferase [Micromonosporaceae bacterium]|nr:GNAT family N-acetyltransferase [Micromonosporaceae bacterium]